MAKAPIFVDRHDRQTFLKALISRLDEEGVTLVAYCLMPNHYHLLLHQKPEFGISKLMQRSMTSYTRRFNTRHGRVGPLCQNRFKGIPLESTRAVRSVIAYIHLNPVKDYEEFEFSSHKLYLETREAVWFDRERATGLFGSVEGYDKFMRMRKRRLKELENEISALWNPFD